MARLLLFSYMLLFGSDRLSSQLNLVVFDELIWDDGKSASVDYSLEFNQGNMLSAQHWKKSVLDTMQNAEPQGLDKKKNRHFFIRNPLSVSGIMMLDKELGAYVYCGRQTVAIVDLDRSAVRVLKHKNCGVDVVAFDNCGFYDFRYSPETKELYYLEKRLTLPDRKRTMSLR